MSYTIRMRRDSTANWESLNPILEEGEFGLELDTTQLKIGDGTIAWNDLGYIFEGNGLPNVTGIADGQMLAVLDEAWAIVDPPSVEDGLPSAVGVPDGKILETLSEEWVIVDAPSGGETPTGGTFRGTWGNEYLAWADDFSDDSIDAPWVITGTDVHNTVGVLPVASAGLAAPLSPYTKTAYVHGGWTVSVDVRLKLDLALLGITDITRIKFWCGVYNGSNGSEILRTIRKNGVDQAGYPVNGSSFSWYEHNMVADSNDVFEWVGYNDPFGVITSADGNLYVSGVRVYATTAPYMFNDVVAKDGAFYRSITDNNVTTPGVDASWELVSGATLDLSAYAPLASPVFTGNPTAPTPSAGDDDTSVATTGFVTAAVAAPKVINLQTGTSYTLVLTDAKKWIRMINAAATVLTVPPESAVAFPIGTQIEGNQAGAGQVTITPGVGVTVNAAPGLKVAAQYGVFGLMKVAADTWVAYGRLST